MEKPDKNIVLETQLCFELYQAHKTYNKFYAAALKPFGLTYAQYIVMLSLYEFKTLSVKELGEKVALDSGTLTPLLRRLEKDNWVVKKRSKQDERRLEVSPSPHAEEIKAELFERVGSCMENFPFSANQYKKYKKEVAKINESIKKATQEIE